ncbi:MAG: hypothetical protein HY748_12435 [Elusimicrobia bacterium]|nr:hypothetical protein [Elusimicrobiota bacterium]
MRHARRSSASVPVVVSFAETSAKKDCWGRLLALAPSGARLSTRFRVERGERVFLSLRIADEEFQGIAALATRVDKDREGYALAELKFTDELQKRRLAKVLLDILST